MGARKLAVNTTINGVTYEAGTVPPAEAAEAITNPKAWGDTGDRSSKSSDAADGPPPQSGKGSGDKAWLDYARQPEHAAKLDEAGLVVADDAKRDDIIAALREAGVDVERGE